MLSSRICRLGLALFELFALELFVLFAIFAIGGVAAGQTATQTQSPAKIQAPAPVPPRKSVTFREFVDHAIQQEQKLTALMRNFQPIVETYVQEEKHDSALQTSPKDDDYFLSRLDLSSKTPSDREFENPKGRDKKEPKNAEAFAAGGFALPVFPDLDHFDRQNYDFEFVRWETLGEVRCGVVNVQPRVDAKNRGFLGRIWVEDQDFNIVRFTGEYTSKAFSKRRTYHFDSWRVATPMTLWMPAYIYTEESDPHDPSSHGLWFKAQTRIWGYDLAHAGDHREYAKPLSDTPVWVDPNRHEASQDLSPDLTVGKSTYTPEDNFVERLQVAGLMAPDGEVDRILETVVNNLQITNNLDIDGVRCRVLLTTPLESFVVGRTIVVSRGLLDVLPDESALAAVLAHELAHIVLRHSLGAEFLEGLNLPFSDLEIFEKLNFRFDATREAEADKKGLELISKSPYKDKIGNMSLFLKALEARSPQLPNLLHGRFSNDFASSHLVGMPALANSSKQLQMDKTDQIAARPLGSRIKVNPWSDRIEMLKTKPVPLLSASQKMPFEVSPFFPPLRPDEQGKSQP
jgi:hypothetical protein